MLNHSRNDVHDALAITGDAEWFEYSKAANPIRPSLSPEVPAQAFLPDLYADGPTRLVFGAPFLGWRPRWTPRSAS